MHGSQLDERLRRLDRPLGDGERTLIAGDCSVRVVGLDEELCERLHRRWGAFLTRAPRGEPRVTVELFGGGNELWLDAPRRGERYRIETVGDGEDRLVASYHFALGAGERPRTWRVGITEEANEPLERILDNTLRFVTARMATEDGGFAMHAAGVFREGRAWLLAGASQAGKSTAVGLLAPADSFGDDFGLVLPGEGGWFAPALPFDNSERVDRVPPEGLLPVAGIWRLFQSETTRVEPPPRGRGVSSLMGCVAFPWTMPDLGAALLMQVERFVVDGYFRHLHFTRDAELWPLLEQTE
jgi:hypothetical protein